MHRILAYIELGMIFILTISILYLPVLLILKKKGKNPIRQLSYLGLACSVFLIIFATILFMPIDFHPEKYVLNLNPLNWLTEANSMQQFVVEKIPNILLFIPLGFFLPAVFKSQRKLYHTTLICFIITFSVECFQYFIGRSADVVDIITNLSGAVFGYMVFATLNHFCKSTKLWKLFINRI